MNDILLFTVRICLIIVQNIPNVGEKSIADEK